MSSTIQTPPVITTEIDQPVPYKVVLGLTPSIKTTLGGGPQGIAGAPGTNAGGFPQVYEYTATVGGAQARTLGVSFDASSTALYKNGVRQPNGSYSISGRQFLMPTELDIYVDDVITFYYFPLS